MKYPPEFGVPRSFLTLINLGNEGNATPSLSGVIPAIEALYQLRRQQPGGFRIAGGDSRRSMLTPLKADVLSSLHR